MRADLRRSAPARPRPRLGRPVRRLWQRCRRRWVRDFRPSSSSDSSGDYGAGGAGCVKVGIEAVRIKRLARCQSCHCGTLSRLAPSVSGPGAGSCRNFGITFAAEGVAGGVGAGELSEEQRPLPRLRSMGARSRGGPRLTCSGTDRIPVTGGQRARALAATIRGRYAGPASNRVESRRTQECGRRSAARLVIVAIDRDFGRREPRHVMSAETD